MNLDIVKEITNSKETVMQNKLAFSLDEISIKTSLSVAFLRKEARRGKLKVKKFGARVCVLTQDLQNYLQGSEN